MFFVYVALVAMLRHRTMGTDTNMYTGMFQSLAMKSSLDFSAVDGKAPVFVIIEWIIAMISSHPQMYIATFSLIVAVGFAVYIYRSSCNVSFSCFLYIGMTTFYFTMNGMRQATAEALAFNAYLDLRKNIKSVRGWVLYVMALGIHPSCAIFLPGIFFARMATKNSVKKMTVISVASAVALGGLITAAINLFTAIFPAYAAYGGGAGVLGRSQQQGRIIIYYMFLGGIAFLYTIRRWHSKTSDMDYPNCVFGAVLGILFFRNDLVKRMALYYLFPYTAFIPTVFQLYPKGERNFLYVMCFIALAVFAMWNLLENKSSIVPYRLFFM
ncbi:MAG: EpsG family protein [Synergistaceae bacterium]|nr:EpsG family protein [Synergistaceae bacterium]